MNRPDNADLQPLKRLDGNPAFDEPWQAQALAMADTLVANGFVPADVWSESLGLEIRERISAGAPDDAGTYYGAVLAALERLAGRYGGVSDRDMVQRREDWEQAYLNTPHGQPVKLRQ